MVIDQANINQNLNAHQCQFVAVAFLGSTVKTLAIVQIKLLQNFKN